MIEEGFQEPGDVEMASGYGHRSRNREDKIDTMSVGSTVDIKINLAAADDEVMVTSF